MASGLFEMGDRNLFDNRDYGYQYDQDRLLELIKIIRNFDKLSNDKIDLYRKSISNFDPETINEVDYLERMRIKHLNEGLNNKEQELNDQLSRKY